MRRPAGQQGLCHQKIQFRFSAAPPLDQHKQKIDTKEISTSVFIQSFSRSVVDVLGVFVCSIFGGNFLRQILQQLLAVPM
jgi:hypothetical protein